jgi:hypothetical protein
VPNNRKIFSLCPTTEKEEEIVSCVGGCSVKTKANKNKHSDPKEAIPMLSMCGNKITSSNQIK